MGRVDDLSTAEKIGDASDTQNLEYAAPQVPKTDSLASEDPNAIVEEEPELHARTYLAVMALFFLNFVQVYALTGPPAIVSRRAQLDLYCRVRLKLKMLFIPISLHTLESILMEQSSRIGCRMPSRWCKPSLVLSL